MNKIRVLDCTLRDGGRVFNCLFTPEQIESISSELTASNIEIIELGFLDETKNNLQFSTYFNDIEQTKPFINPHSTCEYSVFINFKRFNVHKLPQYNKTLPKIIRIGFNLDDFMNSTKELQQDFEHVINLGYTVFMQALNTHTYDKNKFKELLTFANKINPDTFAIVDSYGSMYPKDLEKYFTLIKEKLNPQINLNFHSHNNINLSFALTLWLLNQEKTSALTIDSTLYGMGRGGGNLATELLCAHLNNNLQTNYDLHTLTQLIEKEIISIQKTHPWGHSLQAFLGGINKIHPHNIQNFYEEFKNGKN